MPKVDLTEHETATILSALDQAHKSAIRAQNTGKLPQLKEVWKAQEHAILSTIAKLRASK